MPPLTLLAPLLLLVLLLVLLVLLRRRRDAADPSRSSDTETSAATSAGTSAGTGVPSGLPASEEVRLLRMQVETLTEALRDASAGTPGAPATAAPMTFEPAHEPGPAPVRELSLELGLEPIAHPVLDTVVDNVPTAQEAPTPAAPVAPAAPVKPAVAVAADPTARHYADLSRTLAQAGRMREAALAQWAGDLRVLRPLLGSRAEELYTGLVGLSPSDAAAAVTASRTVAADLLGPEVSLAGVLPDISHLSSRSPFATPARSAYPGEDVSSDELPDVVVRALESVLMTSATAGEDESLLSVGLRCDLVAHVVPGHTADETLALVREMLEPHEHAAFDRELAG